MGQQQKGYIILTSRKIVSVKALTDFSLPDTLFVRGLLKKSYGEQIPPAVILFKNNFPQKAYCECPVGVSGLCCHVLALLLFLKHFYETKQKILSLTCTDQLQKWHCWGKKGSIPIVPLCQIKLTSAHFGSKKINKNVHEEKIVADQENSKGIFLK